MNTHSDRDLLFGILALQMGFVSREQLIAVVSTWMQDKSKSVSRLLREQGALQEDTYSMLETLVEKHLQLHSNDPARSLASLPATGDWRECLAECGAATQQKPSDPDVTCDCTPGAQLDATATGAAVDRGSSTTGPLPGSAAPVVHSATLPGGRFRVLHLFAKGGLGKVSVALDEELRREVAFKELLDTRATDSTARARLKLEAEITGSLEHPGVVPVYGLGVHSDGRPFYAMRLIRGETLYAAIERFHTAPRDSELASNSWLQMRRLLNHFLAACNVLEYAHSRGIIHRDLKPDNIMLGKYGETLVVDWGLAKTVKSSEPVDIDDATKYQPHYAADVTETQLGTVMGTPSYMSPEQAQGQVDQVSAASDIYSLGATLYCLLTNRQPFHGDSAIDIVKKVGRGQFPRPREVKHAVPAALEAVCLKAMALEPTDRYVSAATLGEEIEHFLADEPVAAYRENVWQRLGRWTRRHRAWTQAGAAALLLVAVILGSATIWVNRARQTAVVLADKNEKLAEREQVAKDEAVTHLTEAREAVDTWLTGMSDALQFYPGMQEARRRLLEKAVHQYQQFAQQPSAEPQLIMERGRACVRLGDVHQMLNDNDAALQAYAWAKALFEGLLHYAASAPEATVEWASSQNRTGLVLSEIGRYAEAETAFAAAVEKLQATPQDVALAIRYTEITASTLTNWGTLLLARGEREKAEQQLDQARRLFEDLLRIKSPEPRNRASLATLQTILARLKLSTGRYEQASADWNAALSVIDQLVRQAPDQPDYLETRASTRLQAAGLLRLMGKYEEELNAYRAVIADYAALEKALPDVPAYRESMALTRTDLAQALHELGRNPAARDELEQASPVLNQLAVEYPMVPRYYEAQAACRDILAQVLLDLDRAQEAKVLAEAATEAYQRLANMYAEVPDYRERLAVTGSHLGQAKHRLQENTAQKSFDEAIGLLNELMQQNAANPAYRSEKAYVLQNLGSWYHDNGERVQAEKAFTQAAEIWEQLAQQDTPEYLYRYCRLLLLCPLQSRRDPPKALPLAQRLEQLEPANPNYVMTRGMALYFVGQAREAFEMLRRAASMRTTDHPEDWFLISMTQARLEDLPTARASFERACQCMQISAPGCSDLVRLRKEAEAALGQP